MMGICVYEVYITALSYRSSHLMDSRQQSYGDLSAYLVKILLSVI